MSMEVPSRRVNALVLGKRAIPDDTVFRLVQVIRYIGAILDGISGRS